MSELAVLTGTAAYLGLIHTLIGPDHYLPFVAMARARDWSRLKVILVTALSGLGHVMSSVALGVIGVVVGIAVARLKGVEEVRGDLAAWLLIAFGLVYFSWGVYRSWRNRPHGHGREEGGHSHGAARDITPWVLFTIFVFGPCEPLIPLVMVAAATGGVWGGALVAGVFSAVTILTMLAAVMALTFGLRLVKLHWLERHGHALAGATIALCGGLILLGL